MATIGTLVVYLDINSSELKKGEVQAKKSFVRMEKQAKKSFGNIESFAVDAAKSIIGIYAGLQLVDLARDIVKVADTMKLLNGRLKLVTNSQEEFNKAQEELFRIANVARVPLEETVGLYTRMARAARVTGKSQGEMLQVTDSINKALTVSGATVAESSGALIQLSQGLAANAFRGQEMNSVLEQTPRVAQLISDGLGVTIGQLREMGAAGELTAERVIDAILSQKKAIDREFGEMPKTVGQSITVMTNHIKKFIGDVDEAGAFTAKIAEGITKITEAIKTIDVSTVVAVVDGLIHLSKIAIVGGVMWVGLSQLPVILGVIIKVSRMAALSLAALRLSLATSTGVAGKASTIWAALNTSLYGTSVSALAATGALGKLKIAGGALFAAFVGWEIGKWLTDNFEWARVAGIHFVDDTIKGWYHLEKITKIVFAAIGSGWTGTINTMRSKYADFLEFSAKGARFISKDAANSMKKTAASMRKTVEQELTFEEAKVKINLEFDKKMAERAKRIGQMLGEASRSAAERAAMAPKPPKPPRVPGATDGEAKKLADAQQSLMDRLLPLQKLQKDYQSDLALLEGWYGKNATKTAEYEVALNNLTQAYEEGKKAILSPELEARIKNEEQLQDILFNRIELEKAAIDLAVTAKELTGAEEAKARIEVLNQELQARQAIHDQIMGTSNEAILARQEELMAIQEINMAILEQQNLLSNTSWVEGAKAAWAEYSKAALDSGAQAEQFFSSTFQKLEDAVVGFAETGTFEFEEFAKSVLSELLRVQVRALMVKAITSAVGAFHDGMDPSYNPPKFHNGMSPTYQPPRLHNGLKPDEFPAILQAGERVTSKKDVNTQNEQLADYERFKATGGGEAGGGMSVSVPINLDPSFSKRFRSELQEGIEGQVMKTINKFS